MSAAGLTRVQRKILEFIRNYTLTEGVSPTTREIAAGIGIKSPGGAAAHLHRMAERGAITFRFRQARSITIVDGRAITILLPRDLDARVRALADRPGVTVEAVIIECVRRHLFTARSVVPRETSPDKTMGLLA